MPAKLPAGKRSGHTYRDGMVVCPYENTINIIGDRWSLMILRSLKFAQGASRFNELMRSLKGISSKTLSEKLKDLVFYGILDKKVVTVTPLVVQYSLTDKGEDLIPILDAMAAWSDRWEKD